MIPPELLHFQIWLVSCSRLGDIGHKFYIIIEGRVSVRIPPPGYIPPSEEQLRLREIKREERKELKKKEGRLAHPRGRAQEITESSNGTQRLLPLGG